MASNGWMDAVNPFDTGTDAAKIFNGTAAGMVNGGVQAGIFDTKPNWGSIAAQSFGNALGDSFTQQKVATDARQGKSDVSNDDRSKAGYYLNREQEISLQDGSTRTDYGDDYADGDGVLASSVGGRRRADRDRLELRGVNTEPEDSIARQRALRDLQRRADTLESTNAQLQALTAEVMKSSGASSPAIAGTGLTISTDFPFPAEQLPDGGFFRGLVAGQRSVLDAGQTSFAENVGAGVRGALLSPINTVTGLISEVGSQYKDMYNLLSGAGADYTPSSALVTSLQREGAGSTLLNMGAAALGSPVAPVIDLLEGRYEQAGAGLPGTLAAGFGLVRGVGVRLGGNGAFSPIAPGGGLMAHELAGGHLLQKHVGQTEQQLVTRLQQEPHITGSSSFYDRPTAEASVAAAIDARQNEINAWLATSKPQFKVEYTLQDPVGISVMQGASKASDATGLRLILRRDNALPTGYRIHTGFPIQ